MGRTLQDKPLPVVFQEGTPVTLVIDPKGELVQKEGRNGPYDLLIVKHPDGRPALLSVSSSKLAAQIQALPDTSKVQITKTGTGVNTTYNVKVVDK